MTVVVFTPTCRFGGLDVVAASLKAQTRTDLVWLIGDDLYPKRFVPHLDGLQALHFDTGENKRNGNQPSSLASAYHRAIDMARNRYDADLFVSVQDYMWLPPRGIERFAALADEHPTALLTGLCSHSEDPTAEEVVNPTGGWTVFAQPYDGHKPERIGWVDCRLERFPDRKVSKADPLWWETNWAAIPRTILHDRRLNYDPGYDRGFAYENQDYAIRAFQLGYEVVVDARNHAISLPHKSYFPEENEQLNAISNREWHESRYR